MRLPGPIFFQASYIPGKIAVRIGQAGPAGLVPVGVIDAVLSTGKAERVVHDGEQRRFVLLIRLHQLPRPPAGSGQRFRH